MFLGTFNPKLDDKGRLILPAKFRDLCSGVVITRGQENCLYMFTQAEFERIHQEIKQAPLTSKQGRNFLRVFLAGAHDEMPDKQNRVTIPQALRKYASLERELAVVGVGSRVEIWDAKQWQEYLDAQEQAFAEIEEEVIPGVF
ncbi:division/cell wall cluster transcriptional repressor MraZ [Leucobacter sp. OH1287]|uniref:division/cell wall cluster transcriptional repressor MraZ n=1 Tax=Leucobacter sp. OH1287 TaxID=2491049 RepID=UPI000F5E5A6B|nr:division/cell wall cluster transcriptional repressor MraZ [Leucobacter sp. OH1287]RRD60206.1 transcriptional regulator MraZ [Leucobacter sp. OH1287]